MTFIPFKYKNHIGRPCKISKDMLNSEGTFTAGHEFIVDYRPSKEYDYVVDNYNNSIDLKPIKNIVFFWFS